MADSGWGSSPYALVGWWTMLNRAELAACGRHMSTVRPHLDDSRAQYAGRNGRPSESLHERHDRWAEHRECSRQARSLSRKSRSRDHGPASFNEPEAQVSAESLPPPLC